MTEPHPLDQFTVSVRAAQLRMKVDRQLERPSPAWIVALVREGERREREAAAG